MLRVFTIALLLAVAGMSAPIAVPNAAAQMTPVGNMPLVVIRFNQRQVFYERQLYMALERAVAVKPSVQFEIVSYVPTGKDAQAAADYAARARADVNKVLNSFAEMGVPRSRLSIAEEPDGGLKYHEVHIFVY